MTCEPDIDVFRSHPCFPPCFVKGCSVPAITFPKDYSLDEGSIKLVQGMVGLYFYLPRNVDDTVSLFRVAV